MKRMIDQTVLLIYCMVILLFVPLNTAFVGAALTAVIYGSAGFFLNTKREHLILTVICLAAALFCPEILFFMPAVIYSVLEWEQYPAAVVLAGAALLCWGGQDIRVLWYLIPGGLLGALLQYKEKSYEQLEQKLRRTRDDSTELNILLKDKNQNLLKQQDYEIYTATLKERNRIAREIHDNVGHMLSRSILMVGAMKAINQEQKIKAPLEQLEDTLNAAMTNVRESVHDLHDESVNLKETVKGLAEEFEFCPVELTYDCGYEIPKNVKYSFITIIKEALNNVMKHSDAAKVQILLREHPGIYQLVIEDNGRCASDGGNLQESPEVLQEGSEMGASRGMGIRNMQERVSAMGGTFQVKRTNGFRIYITVPKENEGEQDENCNCR